MSRTTSSWLRRRLEKGAADDGGFSLVEILVAMTVFALMTTASVPLVVGGLRASTVTKMDTGAKNLAQERMEMMRNLPFHVAAVAATATSQDLLDLHYPNLAAAASTSASGFVAASAARRAGEPAGAFYRTVFDLAPQGLGNYTQYVATQFLNAGGAPLVPPTGYERQTENADNPPSLVVGVTIVTEWTVGTLSKSLPLFTEIGEGRAEAPIVTAVSRTTALKITGTVDLGSNDVRDLLVEAGKVSLDGAVTTGTTAASSAQSATAAVVPGTKVEGAARGVTAPPTQTAVSGNEPSGRILTLPGDSSTVLARFGVTKVGGVAASTAQGLPSAGSSSSPVTAVVAGGAAFSYTNLPTEAADLGIAAGSPVVFVTTATGSEDQVSAGGRFATTVGSSQAVTTNSTATVRRLSLVPTSFAPQGIVQVALRASASQCTSGLSSVSAQASYTAVVQYWSQAANGGEGGYVQVAGSSGATSNGESALSSNDTSDALAALLTSNPVVYGDLRLGDYFSTMSNRTAASLSQAVTTFGKRVELSLPSAVTFTTRLLRGTDPLSAVTVDLGSFSCIAEDRR